MGCFAHAQDESNLSSLRMFEDILSLDATHLKIKSEDQDCITKTCLLKKMGFKGVKIRHVLVMVGCYFAA